MNFGMVLGVVSGFLRERGYRHALIGAVALAAHGLLHETGDRERANEFLCKALADADRLRIPEAETIRGILQRNGLTCR